MAHGKPKRVNGRIGYPDAWRYIYIKSKAQARYLSTKRSFTMSPELQERAQKVVASFKASLDEEERDKISGPQYEELALMITEALSDQVDDVVARMESLVQELRSETKKGQMGM
jgi:hypothetical protein